MTRGILIAGNQSGLFNAISNEAGKRVENYTTAIIPNRFEESKEQLKQQTTTDKTDAKKNSYLLQWNPSSPISARTLVLSAKNRLGKINEVFLICDPPACNKEFLTTSDIEIMINDNIKSWFFLVKEIEAVFRDSNNAAISMIYPEIDLTKNKNNTKDILSSAALSSFKSLTENLLKKTFSQTYTALGFSNSEIGKENEFAAFVYKILEENNKKNNGKLHRFGRLKLFS
jgi:hypothetical protein